METNQNTNKSPKNQKQGKPAKKQGPGRPMAAITVPNRQFTFADLVAANSHVTPLTLRKFMARDAARRNMSEIIKVKDKLAQPDNEKGLGRKAFVYTKRSKVTSQKAAAKVSVPLTPEPAAPPAVVLPDAPVAEPVIA